MRWRTFLRNCATSWKVEDSIPVVIIGRNPSGRIMALGWTQPLTYEYQEYFLEGKAVDAQG